MYCPNCGTKNDEGSMFCGNCGAKLGVSATPVYQSSQTNNTTNGCAIAGFIVSLASIFIGTAVVPPIVGLILSIVGLNEIKKKGGQGKGFAIAGIVISSIIIGLLLLFVFFFILALMLRM